MTTLFSKIALICIVLSVLSCSINGKKIAKTIEISFYIDEEKQLISNQYSVLFITNKDTLKGFCNYTYLELPALPKDSIYTIIFKHKNYSLSFPKVYRTMIIPEQDIEWKFGIDNKPFDKLLGLLTEEEYKMSNNNQIQYLQFNPKEFGNGIQLINKLTIADSSQIRK